MGGRTSFFVMASGARPEHIANSLDGHAAMRLAMTMGRVHTTMLALNDDTKAVHARMPARHDDDERGFMVMD
ncbi:MAG TPA: hypothetical protein VEL47_01345 [Myxococcota bacterium]|nr:hypothetical protein [Myxococcota bacterium]